MYRIELFEENETKSLNTIEDVKSYIECYDLTDSECAIYDIENDIYLSVNEL